MARTLFENFKAYLLSNNYLKYIFVFVAFCLGLLIILVIFDSFIMPGIVHNREVVTVPDVTGKAVKYASSILQDNKFEYKISDEEFSPQYKPGTVIRQFPKQYSKVKSGRLIYLTVSKGNELVSVPNLVHTTLREARVTLMRYGLVLANVSYQNHDSIGVDTIITQSIRPGSQVPYGSNIDIIVCLGPTGQISVPQLFGKSYEQALELLTLSNLTLGQVTNVKDNTYLKNTVITQSPSAGTMVAKSTAVDLSITK